MAIDSNVLQEVVDALKQDPEIKNNVYQATVSRIDGEGVVWVNIAGSDTETPTAITSAEVAPGDAVNVEWRNNKLYIGGNYSNPSAGVVRVSNVEQIADVAVANASRAQTAAANAESAAENALASASTAKTAAETAQTAADTALVNLATTEDVVGVLNWITAHGTMTSQSGGTFDPNKVYFVQDAQGDYVVQNVHYSVVPDPKAEDINSYYVLSIDESVQNYVATHIVVDTEGLWIIPDAGGNKVLIATGSGSTYTTAGTYIVGKVNNVDTVLASFTASGAQIGRNDGGNVFIDNDSVDIKDGSTVVATFGIDGSQIGQNGQSRIIEDAYSMQMIDKGQHSYLKIKDLRGESGIYEFQESFRSDGVTTYYSLSINAIEEEGVYQINVTFTPSSYHYSGTITRYRQGIELDPPVPDGYYIHARYKSDSDFCKEYTLGSRRVYGSGSSDQVGPMSTVIGFFNSAEAFASYGEGYDTHSRGNCSHAEGWETYASGDYSHSQNMHTYANGEAQTAIGKWNISDYNNEYALIVGNGSQGTPSNALTVDWSGNVMAQGMAGMIQMFAGSTAPTGWLMCDGSAVSRTTYATLFAVIGTTYGTGDGSTTFNLPDLRGRMPLGSSSSHSLASTGGSEYIQAHTHSDTIKAKTPKFTHSISSSNSNVNLLGGGSEQSYGKAGSGGSTYPYKRLSVADHAATDCTMSGSVGAVSGATTGNEGNMPPFLTINYIIATGKTA